MKIAKEKIEELWKFFPSLQNEIIEERGNKNSSTFQKDYVKLVFKNGSYLDIVAAKDSSRGGRRTSGLVEESAKVDGKVLSEVVIPMMNVSRRGSFGAEDPDDITNKAQLYINLFCYSTISLDIL